METKKITIPKEIFEKTFLKDSYFKEGGTKDRKELHKALTGEYMFENEDEKSVNAEIEKNEYIFDSQGIKKAEGNTHENGGIEVNLEENTRIISDHLKLSAKEVKKINDLYDLGAKTSDTYAKVLDKFGRKSGLDKINKELEEYIAKLDKQQKETKDETTLALNTEYLTEEINEEFKEKAPLEKEREIVFNSLFEMQEASKTKEKDKNSFQTGGIMTYNGDPVIEMGKKYNISPERAKELIASFKKGGKVLSEYQNAGTYTAEKQRERFKDFYKEAQALGYEGDANPNAKDLGVEAGKLQKFMAEKAPEAVLSYFLESGQPMTAKGVDMLKQQNPEAFQQLGLSINKDSASYTTEEKEKLKQTLGNKLDNNFWIEQFKDNKWDWRFPAVSPNMIAQPIGMANQLPTAQGILQPNEIIQPLPAVEQSPSEKITQPNISGMFLTPDQTPLSPGSQMAHLKPQRRFERIDPIYISPERQLAEIDRQQQQAYNNISMLPDQQAAAVFSSMGANTADATSKVIGEVNRYNAQAQEGANRTNAQIAQSEENAAWQDALNYERNTYLAKDKTDQDWRAYYNRLAENQMNDWKTIEILNRGNAMNPEVQFTGQGYEVAKPTFSIPNTSAQATTKKTTPKKKNGGRFKK